ncbi:hypothetical protein MRB53_012974 [Persea americana]|uniref:Uncharacterized protein n=1 Tax=Persea americana TaxID=3435 RepID=A0ACC2LZ47_PERAE|nr:hypothetical protein MRB53_012974 [Persea americana]
MARLEVLRALDTERARFYHFKAFIVTGIGLFGDSYDLFCITPVMTLIGRVYYADEKGLTPGVIPLAMMSTVVGISLLGTVVGQLVFGYLGAWGGGRSTG